jgi:hypothetical protein
MPLTGCKWGSVFKLELGGVLNGVKIIGRVVFQKNHTKRSVLNTSIKTGQGYKLSGF